MQSSVAVVFCYDIYIVLLISLFDRELMSCIVRRQLISLSKLLLVLPGHTAPADSTYSMYSANTFKAYAMAVASS